MDPVRRDFLRRSARAAGLATLALPWAGWPIAARAANLKRLGILSIFGREDSLELFRTGGEKHLAQRGWVVGNTLAIEWRFAQKDMSRLGPLARELVEARVDAICTWGTSATRAVQQATRAIPIVTGVTDPVGYGFAKSLARPGGNFTGLSYLTPEVMRKELELLRGLLPKLAQLVYVTRSPLESIQERARQPRPQRERRESTCNSAGSRRGTNSRPPCARCPRKGTAPSTSTGTFQAFPVWTTGSSRRWPSSIGFRPCTTSRPED